MGEPNRNAVSPEINRYESLRLKESLAKSSQYIPACKELSFILKNGYSKFTKSLQSHIFQDTLFAFRLLPQMPMQSAISSANSLLRSAEFALPKQKRALAVKEHKNAVVASKRKSKANLEEAELDPLPHDVLVHIFSFLDVQSLVSASAVCWSWNIAACDDHLWKVLYITFLGNCNNFPKHNRIKIHGVTRNEDNIGCAGNGWRHAYKTAYIESYGKYNFSRGYCRNCCSIVSLRFDDCLNKCCHQIKPISTQQVVEYIVHDRVCADSSPDSDSDSDSDGDGDDMSALKLWAYPRMNSYDNLNEF